MSDVFIEGLSLLGLSLTEAVVQKEIDFLDELLRWNQRVNLTSIRDRDEAIEKHLLDSLLLLLHLDDSKHIMDMGSGGGFPGIPLAIANPALRVVSIDSVGKKINFQKHIKRLLQLDNLTILQSRVEALEKTCLEKKYDLVVCRAFTSLEVAIKFASPWLTSGGRILAMKGPEGRDELRDAAGVLRQNEFDDPVVCSYHLPFSHAERQLLILKK